MRHLGNELRQREGDHSISIMASNMPIDLVLVRHGQSEGNLAQAKSMKGDDSFWTEEFSMRPSSMVLLFRRQLLSSP